MKYKFGRVNLFENEKTSLLVDMCLSKTPFLNLPIVDMLSCNQWMKGKKYFTHLYTQIY